jgi:hypothetical protein
VRIDANTIEYTVTVDDPEVFTRPWVMRMQLHRQTHLDRILEYQCQSEKEEANGAFERVERTWYPAPLPADNVPFDTAAGLDLPVPKRSGELARHADGTPDTLCRRAVRAHVLASDTTERRWIHPRSPATVDGRFNRTLGRRHARRRIAQLQRQGWLNEAGDVISHAQTVRETFTPVADGRIVYRVTVADPIAFTRPWTIEMPFNRQDEQLLEVACLEDNGDLQHLKDVRDEWRAEHGLE